MEPKPSRKSTRLPVEGHNSLPVPPSGTKILYESRSNGLGDLYATRDTPNKIENEIQFSTSEGCHLSAPLQSTLYNETERLPGASSRCLTPQNVDSKRPKLVSTYSPRNGADCERNNSDSMWRCSQFPRSSAVQFNSTSRGETIFSEGIEMERRTESSPEEGVENRILSTAQGARPRLGSLRHTASNLSELHSPPSESRSVFSRDSSRNSSRSSNNSTAFSNIEVTPQRSTECGFILSRAGSGTSESITSQRRNMSVLQPRSPNDFASESNSRCRPRQLLSRLASSMSSTFSSNRRPNQGHSNVRSFEAACSIGHSTDISLGGRQNFAQANGSGRREATNFSNNRSSESSQGFGFLRWRRLGVSNISQSQNANDGVESLPNLRQDDSEYRNTASWLSSSLRNRCTPLFNRRRREGRDETARMAATPSSTINEARVEQPSVLQREVRMFENSSREQSNVTQGATAASSGALSSTFCTPSVPESPRGQSTSGIAGIFPNSVIRLSMPYGLGDEFSDNILIAVDFANHVNTHQEKQKTASASKDPEKLRKIQESLLLEDSDDDEGDICRICQMGAGATTPPNPLIQPCNCTGSLQYVHQECMKKWLQSKINSGADLTAITTCELCKEKLQLDFEDFDVHELYRTHADEQAQYEFISSGLYLVLLLHLCEQRFSDMVGGTSESRTRLRFIHLARTLQQHIQDLETTDEDSEEEQDSFDSSRIPGDSA
ncbi:E3 ubiquitin-protein ligase MARCH7 isoform X2 [Chiloscyllium plagiosum]|uniref:E3 ubiquitin-protein ligase MARCH7 isoform X2 n=1 Tax=Chiloscyllium plagiosum TaxID=36176 RepID=UPI001CB86925|nr:E3 ubiquitin-protein ligase MARCH7 isoform X2 [Chiloscyllium plagiosum]